MGAAAPKACTDPVATAKPKVAVVLDSKTKPPNMYQKIVLNCTYADLAPFSWSDGKSPIYGASIVPDWGGVIIPAIIALLTVIILICILVFKGRRHSSMMIPQPEGN